MQDSAWIDGLEGRLPFATGALFDAYERQHEPICLPDTRVDLLQQIYDWADGKDNQLIFWLNGLAGTGKSTISRTVARKYSEQNRLGASFFFSRGGGEVGRADMFVTTIASQLASTVPSLRGHISDAVKEHGDISNRSLSEQWRQLVIRPLSKLRADSHPSSYILVIDALDECQGEEEVQIIPRLLAEIRSLRAVPVRIFLTSRRETPIRHGFYEVAETEHQDFVLQSISLSIVDRDIGTFFKYKFGLIGRQKKSLGAGWPGEETVSQLVQMASGLFIWAATACRFIEEVDKAFFIRKRLATILHTQLSMAENQPEKCLNEVYITVLKHSIPPRCSKEEEDEFLILLQCILGSIVTLISPLSVNLLSKLLSLDLEDINDCLEDLHAIMDIPTHDASPIRLHHPSFRDFILNKERCIDLRFWVNEKQAHRILADQCIRIMSKYLKQDVCGQEDPGTFVAEVESSQLRKWLPPEVRYACLHWIQHLRKAGTRLRDDGHVHQFLQVHFLHWLEALGWIRSTSEGIYGILSLEAQILVSLPRRHIRKY